MCRDFYRNTRYDGDGMFIWGTRMQTILVVDDTLNVQKLLEDLLSSKGYRVLCASNGRDAQLIMKKNKPDLILLDIMMPQMDGYAFLRRLRDINT